MSEALTRQKEYPTNYPSDAVAILDAMSFTHGRNIKLVGSMSIRSQQYAGDYDAYESVPPASVPSLVSRFKQVVKTLRGLPNAVIGDIKCGVIDEWDVVGDPHTRDLTKSRRKLDDLVKDNVITPTERKEAETALKGKHPEKEIKFHILRWTPDAILHGSQVIRGRTVTLADALQTRGLTKVDVVGLVQNNRYTDFSCIYEFHTPNGKVMNTQDYDIVGSLRRDIDYYSSKGKWVKVLKRQFALAKFQHKEETLKYIHAVLNSDLGRLYQIVSDLGTLLYLLEAKRGDTKKMRFEIDQMVGRLANIYALPSYLKAEWDVLGTIRSALKSPNLFPRVCELYDRLESIMDKEAKRFVRKKDNGRTGTRVYRRDNEVMEAVGGGQEDEG
jgi:hypothetical protein